MTDADLDYEIRWHRKHATPDDRVYVCRSCRHITHCLVARRDYPCTDEQCPSCGQRMESV